MLRAWLAWNAPGGGPDRHDDTMRTLFDLGDVLIKRGLARFDDGAITPAGAALLARVEAAERTPKEAEKNRAEAERMETFEAAIRDAAKKGGPYCATHAREAVAALDAARLAGTAPIDAPPAKETR